MTRLSNENTPGPVCNGLTEIKVLGLVAAGLVVISMGSLWRQGRRIVGRAQNAFLLSIKALSPVVPQVQRAPAGGEFFDRYCQAYQCASRDFEKEVCWQCLPAAVVPVAALVSLFKENLFQDDLDLLDDARRCTTPAKVGTAIGKSRGYASLGGNFTRTWLRIRISPIKLASLSVFLLGNETASRPAMALSKPVFKAQAGRSLQWPVGTLSRQ